MNHQEVLKRWENRWVEKNIPWHRKDVNPFLIKYFNVCCKKSCKKICNAFVPLCGKAIEMIWIAKQGCDVVGVEICKTACEDFFAENNFTYAITNINGVAVYMCRELPIAIFKCDFFEFLNFYDKSVKFDFIWDRGGLGSIEKNTRKSYVDIITSLIDQSGSYLLETYVYDENAQFAGPPYNMPLSTLKELFGEPFYCTTLVEKDWSKNSLSGRSLKSLSMCINLVKLEHDAIHI